MPRLRSAAVPFVSLEIGDYVLICNFVEGGESHYQEGMRTASMVE